MRRTASQARPCESARVACVPTEAESRGSRSRSGARVAAAYVKRLRDATGAGMMDCKKALTEADGDFDKAVELLRVKGAKDVGKRLERSTTNGIVTSKY